VVSDKHWVEIYYPQLNATIHVTYKAVNRNQKLLKEFYNDAYVLTSKHQIKPMRSKKRSYIRRRVKPHWSQSSKGRFQSVPVHDDRSTNNFLRGALYFNVKVQNDSLQPAIEYVKKDAMHLINSLRWIR